MSRPRLIAHVRRRSRRTPGRLAALTLAAALALLAGCGGGGDDSGAPAPQEPPEPRAVRSDTLRSLGVSKETSEKPDFAQPAGQPPRGLLIYDVVEGDGAEAIAGRPLSMHYVGRSFSTGEEFDASWDRGEPFAFTLGAGDVITGWDLGIEGMRAGGRRVLVIPPSLAYGSQGSPPAIGPNETLVFVVDLKRVGR